jgi:hypothetical protein
MVVETSYNSAGFSTRKIRRRIDGRELRGEKRWREKMEREKVLARAQKRPPRKFPCPKPKSWPFQVSHLCHNPWCINPKHLRVERRQLNIWRNHCQGRYIVQVHAKDAKNQSHDFIFHPCTHRGRDGSPPCILSYRHITKPGYYYEESASQQEWMRRVYGRDREDEIKNPIWDWGEGHKWSYLKNLERRA